MDSNIKCIILKYISHPVADLLHPYIKKHDDKEHPFYFHFLWGSAYYCPICGSFYCNCSNASRHLNIISPVISSEVSINSCSSQSEVD